MEASKRSNGALDTEPELPPSKKQKRMSGGEIVLELRKEYIAPSLFLHYGDYPLNIVRGQGQYFYDEDSQRYLDTTNNVAHVGHCHPKVVKEASTQMAILNTNSRFLNDRIVNYAKRLCATFPAGLECCFFTNSGSEANDLALQIAQAVSGHSHIIALEGAYHGHLTSLRALSTYRLGGKDKARDSTAENAPSILPLPDTYRGKHRDPETAGSLYAEDVCGAVAEKQGQVACFIHESIMSCAGQIVLPDCYLKNVYSQIRGCGGLCIADEVQSGFGRIGSHFWSFEAQGVCPDIVTMGKPMGNGHPVAAVVTTREIAKKYASRGVEYFNTFGGNPVSMAIADAVLSVIEEEGLQQRADQLGAYLLRELGNLKEKHPGIGDVRGRGLFIGVDFVSDRETREPDSELAGIMQARMLREHKVIVLADGVHGNVIKIKPPMVISQDDCRAIIEGFDAILTSLGK